MPREFHYIPVYLHLLAISISDTKTSEQALDQQEYYNVTRDGVTIYDNPDRLHNEIEMSPNVVYGAGDQKPGEIKMKKNQVYGL